jgi:hypothetical protein
MSEVTVEKIRSISDKLRDWIHDVNNALFVTKGFMEEVCTEVQDRQYLNEEFDHDSFWEMLQTIVKNLDRLEGSVQSLRKYARDDIYKDLGENAG